MWPWTLRATGFGLLAALLCLPDSAAAAPQSNQAYPGMLNYIEGQASIGSRTLDANSAGSAALQPGQTLNTEQGKVEILLTPGVFLRMDDYSSVQMVSPDLNRTELVLERGRATVEVAELREENDLLIDQGSVTAQLVKPGFYEFDADAGRIRVFQGKAEVQAGDRRIKVKGGRELDLQTAGRLKAVKFDKKLFDEDDLDRWSSLRSAYISEANQDVAADYETNAYWSSGWYWDPWFDCFTFIPTDGIFFSPFGWGFYSPWWVYGGPFYGRGHFHHHFGHDVRTWGPGPHYAFGGTGSRTHGSGTFASHGFGRSGGFHGGGGHFSGGFHGAGGGFHGGGSGGSHGGGGGGGHGRG
jgi:hypothetical protein